MTIRFLLVFFSFTLIACKEADNPIGLEGVGLTGFWRGIIKSMSNPQDSVTEVTLSLNQDQTFKLTRLKNRMVATGTYDDFPQIKSLTLRVVDSSVEEFALGGSVRDFEYTLFDGELLLNSTDRIVRLKRPEIDYEDSLSRNWNCQQDNLIWQLSVVGTQFLLYLKSETGASVFMKGSLGFEAEDAEITEFQRIVLFVEDAQPIATYSELMGRVYYEAGIITNIKLTPYINGKMVTEELDCVYLEN